MAISFGVLGCWGIGNCVLWVVAGVIRGKCNKGMRYKEIGCAAKKRTADDF